MRRSSCGVVVHFAELSDAGRDPAKQVNEDSCGYRTTPLGHLAVVCDGMGGHSGGKSASSAALDTILSQVEAAPSSADSGTTLVAAIEAAGRAVFELGGSQAASARPGSTVVALLLNQRGAQLAHVGDSRAYLIRQRRATRLTRDHSLVQQMVDAGVLSAKEAADHPDANRITRALGIEAEVDVELRQALRVRAGDALLLCSDGLTDLVEDAEIAELVTQRIASGPAFVCQALVELANQRGGHDNITVQVIEISEAPEQPEASDPTLVDGRGLTVLTDEDGVPATLGGPRAPKTVPDGWAGDWKGKPSPTLVEEPERATQPGLEQTQPAVVPVAPYAAPPPSAGRRRILLFGVVGLAFVVAAVGVGVVGLQKRGSEDELPPPPILPTVSTAPALELTGEPPAPELDGSSLKLPDAAPLEAGALDAGKSAAGDAAFP